jgi:hypothetical protein
MNIAIAVGLSFVVGSMLALIGCVVGVEIARRGATPAQLAEEALSYLKDIEPEGSEEALLCMRASLAVGNLRDHLQQHQEGTKA